MHCNMQDADSLYNWEVLDIVQRNEENWNINFIDWYYKITIFCNVFCGMIIFICNPTKFWIMAYKILGSFMSYLYFLLPLPHKNKVCPNWLIEIYYLRTVVTQEWLSNLALPLIKHKLSEHFDYNNIISNFAEMKAIINFMECIIYFLYISLFY